MQIKKVHGIITSIRPHKELDKLLSVFSYEYGRIRIIAKGVRKITSRRGYHIDLLNEVEMELEETGTTSGTGPLYLREITIKNSFQSVKTNPLYFTSACLIASFLDRLLPEFSPQHELFELTIQSFVAFGPSENPPQILLTYFLKTLRMLGHIPQILKREEMRSIVLRTLRDLDPQLILNARRTLGMFSSLESKRSN